MSTLCRYTWVGVVFVLLVCWGICVPHSSQPSEREQDLRWPGDGADKVSAVPARLMRDAQAFSVGRPHAAVVTRRNGENNRGRGFVNPITTADYFDMLQVVRLPPHLRAQRPQKAHNHTDTPMGLRASVSSPEVPPEEAASGMARSVIANLGFSDYVAVPLGGVSLQLDAALSHRGLLATVPRGGTSGLSPAGMNASRGCKPYVANFAILQKPVADAVGPTKPELLRRSAAVDGSLSPQGSDAASPQTGAEPDSFRDVGKYLVIPLELQEKYGEEVVHLLENIDDWEAEPTGDSDGGGSETPWDDESPKKKPKSSLFDQRKPRKCRGKVDGGMSAAVSCGPQPDGAARFNTDSFRQQKQRLQKVLMRRLGDAGVATLEDDAASQIRRALRSIRITREEDPDAYGKSPYTTPRQRRSSLPTHGWRRFFIAVNLFENEAVLPHLTAGIVAFIEDEVRPMVEEEVRRKHRARQGGTPVVSEAQAVTQRLGETVVVSIFANGSRDRTAQLVWSLLVPALQRAGITRIFADPDGNCFAMNKRPSRMERIEWMACVRNRALKPLYEFGTQLFGPAAGGGEAPPAAADEHDDRGHADQTPLGVVASALAGAAVPLSERQRRPSSLWDGDGASDADAAALDAMRALLVESLEAYRHRWDSSTSRMIRFLQTPHHSRVYTTAPPATRAHASDEADMTDSSRRGSLSSHRSGVSGDDGDDVVVLFFNDVFFRAADITTLLESVPLPQPPLPPGVSPVGPMQRSAPPADGPGTPLAGTSNGRGTTFDMACGMDFYVSFYDTWVSRDHKGNAFLPATPYSNDPEVQDMFYNVFSARGSDATVASAAADARRLALPVKCCWNGVAALRGRLFFSTASAAADRERQRPVTVNVTASTEPPEQLWNANGIGFRLDRSAPHDLLHLQELITRRKVRSALHDLIRKKRTITLLRHANSSLAPASADHPGRLSEHRRWFASHGTLHDLVERTTRAVEVLRAANWTAASADPSPSRTRAAEAVTAPDHERLVWALARALVHDARAVPSDALRREVETILLSQHSYYRKIYPTIVFRHSYVSSHGAELEGSHRTRGDVCLSSECLLVCEDIMHAALLREGRLPVLLMNPSVKVAYEEAHFDRIHSLFLYNSPAVFRATYHVARVLAWLSGTASRIACALWGTAQCGNAIPRPPPSSCTPAADADLAENWTSGPEVPAVTGSGITSQWLTRRGSGGSELIHRLAPESFATRCTSAADDMQVNGGARTVVVALYEPPPASPEQHHRKLQLVEVNVVEATSMVCVNSTGSGSGALSALRHLATVAFALAVLSYLCVEIDRDIQQKCCRLTYAQRTSPGPPVSPRCPGDAAAVDFGDDGVITPPLQLGTGNGHWRSEEQFVGAAPEMCGVHELQLEYRGAARGTSARLTWEERKWLAARAALLAAGAPLVRWLASRGAEWRSIRTKSSPTTGR